MLLILRQDLATQSPNEEENLEEFIRPKEKQSSPESGRPKSSRRQSSSSKSSKSSSIDGGEFAKKALFSVQKHSYATLVLRVGT